MFSALTLWTILLPLAPKDEPNPEPPPEGPLVARLVATKTSYTLDRGGMTAAQYKQAIKDGKVTAPAVELKLEFTNNTKADMRIRVATAYPLVLFKLTGKDTVATALTTRRAGVVRYVVLKPGKNTTIAVTTLADVGSVAQQVGSRYSHFWTEAGTYRLSATIRFPVIENYGAAPAGKLKYLSLTTDPIALEVKEK